LPIALYGYETWSSHRLRLFENMGMKKIFGPKRVLSIKEDGIYDMIN